MEGFYDLLNKCLCNKVFLLHWYTST